MSEAPTIGAAADMRFGTWLARDIPHTGMAIQIDIGGGIHYFNKTLSGQRLALHALKNEYPSATLTTNQFGAGKVGGKAKDLVVDGPMFKSCKVESGKVVIELDHADGGLVVAETSTNVKTGLAAPTVIPDGAAQVKLFYLAGEDRVWYPAQVKIEGSKLVVASPKVMAPRGVSYGSGGIGGKPNIYNQALLPLAPFTYYDNEFVTAATWKGEFKVDGVETAPMGILEQCRKMPLLSSQFVDNALLQADQPVTIWGSTLPAAPWSEEPVSGKAEIQFSFAGVEKTIPVTPDMKEWKVILPPQKASAEPKTMKVTFLVNGELAHERVVSNIVFGDVWYVAAPYGSFNAPAVKPTVVVRMMDRASKGDRSNRPRPYTVSTSTTPGNRFASAWNDADGFAASLGQAIAAKTGKPVGIIFMQSAGGKGNKEAALKHWIAAEDLGRAPSLKEDYEQLASMFPGTKPYEANVRRYVNEWKKYWSEYIPALMETKAVPDKAGWGGFPGLAGLVKTDASQVYNVMVDSFTPADLKGIIFMSGKPMVEADEGAHFGEQLTALANSWKEKFACPDPVFLYTVPGASLAPKITKPEGIKGRSIAMEISSWPLGKAVGKDSVPVLDTVTAPLIEKVLTEVYK